LSEEDSAFKYSIAFGVRPGLLTLEDVIQGDSAQAAENRETEKLKLYSCVSIYCGGNVVTEP
jgi:hypothetical protein